MPVTNETFEQILSNRLDNIKFILGQKAKEYVRNNDRLHNFNTGAKESRTNETREDVLYGMMRKHLISLNDILDDVRNHKPITSEIVNEKIGDIINYMILLEVCLLTNKLCDPHVRSKDNS